MRKGLQSRLHVFPNNINNGSMFLTQFDFYETFYYWNAPETLLKAFIYQYEFQTSGPHQ